MADIIKVKPKKKYEWSQDKKFVYVQVPLPAHTSLKKVQIYLSDLIFRVTSQENKQTQSLDLVTEIDYISPDNKFILTNGLLHATLKKAKADQQWTNLLVEDISLAELRDRRKESEQRKEQYLKSIEKNKDNIRVEYDHKATHQMMRFEGEERNELQYKKKTEHEEEIRKVFSNVNEKTGQFQKSIKPQNKQKSLEIERTKDKWEEKQQLALTLLEQEEQKEKNMQQIQIKQKNKSKIIEQVTKQYQKGSTVVQSTQNTMFSEEEIEKYDQIRQNIEQGLEFEDIPVRKATTQKVNFTERVHKNMAARDTFVKEPPMPKGQANKLSNGDLESKNPLWLKDKGDSFFHDKNHISAIEAYTEALKADSKLLSAILNRCACYMKTFKIQEAINDCDQALQILQSQISGDQSQQNHSRMTLAKIKARKGICTAWKGQIQASKVILNEVLQLDLTEDIKGQVNECLKAISKRQDSIRNKARGDDLVKLNNHEAAAAHYTKSIEDDENEYAISNKVLCFNKLKKYQEASQLAEKGIKKMNQFNLGMSNVQTREDRQASVLILKFFYRKAKALEEMGLLTEAQDYIRKGLTINSEDKDLQAYLKQLKKRQNKLKIKKLKEESVSLIKESKVKEALENYSKCLKMLEEAEDIQQYLAILQNQCVCYQKIEKYDDVLSTCIRILKLVNRLESKILEFGNRRQQTPIEKEDLKKISVRTLVRRANAYIKTSQYYNAKSDLEKALEISPDESIRKQLENLKTKLSSNS